MKPTKEECRDVVAQKNGFRDWAELVSTTIGGKESFWDKIMAFEDEVMRLYMGNIKISDGILSDRIPCLGFTFATRLKSFVSDIQCNDLIGCEEQKYIESVATELLEYQKKFAVEQWEKDYLERTSKK